MSSERTHEATPKRLAEAKRRGEAWQAPLLTRGALLLGGSLLLGMQAELLVEAFRDAILHATEVARAPSPALVLSAALDATSAAVALLAPLLLALAAIAALGALVPVGPRFTLGALAFRSERLSIAQGLRSVFSRGRGADVALGGVFASAVALVLVATMRGELRGVLGLLSREPQDILTALGRLLSSLTLRTAAVLLGLGVPDALYRRHRFLRERRMTRREVEREHAESDGEPAVKRARARARRELLEATATESAARASLLVVGGDAPAIALHYADALPDAVPVVLAKGSDELAHRMRHAAELAGVVVRDDASLARALAVLAPGEAIPRALFAPVAQALTEARRAQRIQPRDRNQP